MHTLFIGAAALGIALSLPAASAAPDLAPPAAPAPRAEPATPSGADASGRCPECACAGPGAPMSGHRGAPSNAPPPPTESTGINPRYGRPADEEITAVPNENANLINEGTTNAPPSSHAPAPCPEPPPPLP